MGTTDLQRIFGRALKALRKELERERFGATSSPRKKPGRASANPRHIPVAVKCAVWERDRGQCAFMSDDGHRCEARMGSNTTT